MSIKAVIYDVDGTMVNSEPIHVEAWDKSLRLHGYNINDLTDTFRRTMAGKKPIVIAREMVEELELAVSPEQLLTEKSKLFVQEAELSLTGMPGVVESVKRFSDAGYKLGIGTSLDRSYLDLVLSKLGVINDFDVIVTGDQIKNGKPDPETYTKVAEKLKVSPDECVVLEDAESGIQSAKAAGAYCIVIKNDVALAQNIAQADLVVTSLMDVSTEMIKQFGK